MFLHLALNNFGDSPLGPRGALHGKIILKAEILRERDRRDEMAATSIPCSTSARHVNEKKVRRVALEVERKIRRFWTRWPTRS